MDQNTLIKYGAAAGILFALYKFGPSYAKGGAVAIAAVALASHVPYLKEVV